jgi:hypothetical protein
VLAGLRRNNGRFHVSAAGGGDRGRPGGKPVTHALDDSGGLSLSRRPLAVVACNGSHESCWP